MEHTYKQRDSEAAQELSCYNHLHHISSLGNYGLPHQDTPSKCSQLAQKINQLYSIMDGDELRHLVLQVLTPQEVRTRLLQYELEHYTPPTKDLLLPGFIQEAQQILHRYHHKAGGFLIEDPVWTLHNNSSGEYPLQPDEILFENSVSTKMVVSCRGYLNQLVNRLNKVSPTTVKVTVEEYYPDDEVDHDDLLTNLVWVRIRCRYLDNNREEPPVISL